MSTILLLLYKHLILLRGWGVEKKNLQFHLTTGSFKSHLVLWEAVKKFYDDSSLGYLFKSLGCG